ncbi:UNKNOWN [Stylonychia lemnae]|uniref:C2H2-type domain-containing protein n=1 Tax=Stylonychia lemnae TaxID=5949 RepID=A0A078A017_STYLE|nr:UNKNOWN [Stylonychia lemnae]|eukprot:CDW74123.1 UNKNOWN [Stylonychia lemnae]
MGNKVECPKCRKNFKNSDFLEFHMKLNHFQNDQSGAVFQDYGRGEMRVDYGICLADYCDIFECRDINDRQLKTQVYMDRKEIQDPVQRKILANEPVRYQIVSYLTQESKERLESQCTSLFMNCIDFDLTTQADAIQAFDMLYSIYCKKFAYIDRDQEKRNEEKGEGIDKVLEQLSINKAFEKRDKSKEVWNIIKIICGIFTVILIILYYTGVYFSIFDEDALSDKKRKYENQTKATYVKNNKIHSQ